MRQASTTGTLSTSGTSGGMVRRPSWYLASFATRSGDADLRRALTDVRGFLTRIGRRPGLLERRSATLDVRRLAGGGLRTVTLSWPAASWSSGGHPRATLLSSAP